MHTTDPSGDASGKATVPSSPSERLRELAAILAAGLLRLRNRPEFAATSDMSGEHVPPWQSAESAQAGRNSLGLAAPPRTHRDAG